MKRNKFNLSHYKVGTMPLGKLVPISCFEVLPGDTVQMSSSIFLRLAPMVNPSFSVLKVKWWHFYVPTRLLWDNFENFRTGGPDGLDVSTPPTVTVTGGTQQGKLGDYLGVPIGYSFAHSLLPYRAYYKIYYDFFRDQDLITFDMTSALNEQRFGSGDMTATRTQNGEYNLFNYAWEKDYFTTARPWPQKGAEVSVPIYGSNNASLSVVSDGTTPSFQAKDLTGAIQNFANGNVRFNNPDAPTSGTPDPDFEKTLGPLYLQSNVQYFNKTSGTVSNADNRDVIFNNSGLKAALGSSSSDNLGVAYLNDLREAFALQRFEEARAMYGSRYTEYLRYLGVKSSDARLQRPEYLGGGRTTMQISEVLQTGEDGNNPVGTLRGHGVGAGRSKRFRRFIEEDGYIMTLCSVSPITLYAQGLNKMWSRTVKEDYWTKELQHIGQQEVMTKELYADVSDQDTVFGYQNRYDDYRSIPSTVCGQMRPSGVDEDWTMSRIFNNEPVLNQSFIDGDRPLRNFAEQNYDPVYFMASHSVVARRLMSKTGNPIM